MTKKRKITEEDDASSGNVSLVSGRPPRREAQRVTSVALSPFQRFMNESLRLSFHALNNSYQRHVRTYDTTAPPPPPPPPDMNHASSRACPPPPYYTNDAAELRRVSRISRDQFGLMTSTTVVGFGSDDAQQLGQPTHVDLGENEKQPQYAPLALEQLTGRNIRQVAAGGLHSMALTSEGQVYTWGCGDDGCLGRPAQDDREQATPTLVTGFVTNDGHKEDGMIREIAAGPNHCLFLSIAGNVYMCGMYKDLDSGKFCDLEERVGASASVRGCNTAPVHVFALPNKVDRIFTGPDAFYNAALLKDGTLVTWGMGHNGQLARSADMMDNPDQQNDGPFDLSRPFYYHMNSTSDGGGEAVVNERAVAEKFLKPAPVRFAGTLSRMEKKQVLSVACGMLHLLVAARDPGKFESLVYSCGHNGYGQLGNGEAKSGKDSGVVHELTPIEALKNENIVQVAAGEFHSLALNLNGSKLFSWGRSDDGQLGIGLAGSNEQLVPDPTVVQFPVRMDAGVPQGVMLAKISAGKTHSMAVSIDKELYTWGYNDLWATGHTGLGEAGDIIRRPKKLDVGLHVGKPTARLAMTMQAAGGGHHTILLAK